MLYTRVMVEVVYWFVCNHNCASTSVCVYVVALCVSVIKCVYLFAIVYVVACLAWSPNVVAIDFFASVVALSAFSDRASIRVIEVTD